MSNAYILDISFMNILIFVNVNLRYAIHLQTEHFVTTSSSSIIEIASALKLNWLP